jgi:DNA-binding response OmpR family regulator
VQRSDFSELGLDDWIPKPVPMKDLKSKLYRLQKCQSLLQEK